MRTCITQGSFYLLGVVIAVVFGGTAAANGESEQRLPSRRVLDLLAEDEIMAATAVYELSAMREAWGPSRREACKALTLAWHAKDIEVFVQVLHTATLFRNRLQRVQYQHDSYARPLEFCLLHREWIERCLDAIPFRAQGRLLNVMEEFESELVSGWWACTERIERAEACLPALRSSLDRLTRLEPRVAAIQRRARLQRLDTLTWAMRFQDQVVAERPFRGRDATPDEVLLAANLHRQAAHLREVLAAMP